MTDKYEIYEYEDGDKRVFKNGKAINEFGLLINSLSLLSKNLESELRDCDSIIVDIAIQELESLQAENAELRKQVNIVARSILAEIGAEFEDDKRIAKKSMPFVRAIVLNKIQDFPPTPPKGE